MSKKRMPKSIRKYIRKEKARIRREVLDLKEQEEMINKMYQNILNKPENKTKSVKEDKKTEKKEDKVKK